VYLEILPILSRRNRAVVDRAQEAHASSLAAIHDCFRGISERIRFADGDHGDSRRDSRKKRLG
jgi:hypothetical protein